jgi:hypothetical protein
MKEKNFERMVRLANEFFEAKSDPEQIDIDETVIDRLAKIHPETMGEVADDNGPVAWSIVIPTSNDTMERFLNGTINELELLKRSEQSNNFEAVYLCSALVLPEHRGKGFAKKLITNSIRMIRQDHPITALYYWAFSSEGDALSKTISEELRLPLRKKQKTLPA